MLIMVRQGERHINPCWKTYINAHHSYTFVKTKFAVASVFLRGEIILDMDFLLCA